MKWIVFLFLLFANYSNAQDISIISSYPNLSKNEAISILMSRDFTFSDGSKAKIVLLPRDGYATRQLSRYLGLTSNRFYDRTFYAVENGKLGGYIAVENEIDAVRQVSKTPGSIGYVQDYMIFNSAALPTIINLK